MLDTGPGPLHGVSPETDRPDHAASGARSSLQAVFDTPLLKEATLLASIFVPDPTAGEAINQPQGRDKSLQGELLCFTTSLLMYNHSSYPFSVKQQKASMQLP